MTAVYSFHRDSGWDGSDSHTGFVPQMATTLPVELWRLIWMPFQVCLQILFVEVFPLLSLH